MVPDIGEVPGDELNKATQDTGAKGAKRKVIPLEELTRFTMVKRIW